VRLVGYACKHPEPPLRHAFVPLGDLVVLLGANDTGKSTALRCVLRDLSGGHFASTDADTAKLAGGVFYAELGPGELDRATRSTVDEGRRLRSGGRTRPDSNRPPWDAGLWPLIGLNDLELGDDARSTQSIDSEPPRRTNTRNAM
jgi:hypothetical protein